VSRVLEDLHTEQSDCPLVVVGHRHWQYPLGELSTGCQVLSTDGRVVLLLPE
jgi:hypothetical protein